MLLLRLHRLALRLRPFLAWVCALGFAAAALALVQLLRADGGSPLLGVTLGATVWALLFFAFIRLFQSIPPPVLPQDSFFERLWTRCKLGLYHLLAFAVVLLGFALVAVTIKLVSASAR